MTLEKSLRTSSGAALLTGLLVLCGCQGLTNTAPVSPTKSAGLQSINHIIFMAQENRSLDTYFGQLPAYWAANGFPSQQFDGLPANASNPAYNGTTTPGTATVSAFHMATECMD